MVETISTVERFIRNSPPTSTPGSPPLLPAKRRTPGFWEDIVAMRWMIRPCWFHFFLFTWPSDIARAPASSFRILMIPVTLCIIWALVLPQFDNPWSHLILVSYRLPDTPQGYRAYAKGYWVGIRPTLTRLNTPHAYFLTMLAGLGVYSILYRRLFVHSTIVDNLRAEAHCASLWHYQTCKSR